MIVGILSCGLTFLLFPKPNKFPFIVKFKEEIDCLFVMDVIKLLFLRVRQLVILSIIIMKSLNQKSRAKSFYFLVVAKFFWGLFEIVFDGSKGICSAE